MRRPIFDQFSTGLLAGTVFSLLLAAAIDVDVARNVWAGRLEVFGIFAALMAAAVALLGVQRQIRVQTDQAKQDQRAQLNASLAVLPLVLSNFSHLAEVCFEICLDDVAMIRDEANQATHIGSSAIDADSLSVLRDCIRFSDPTSAKWLSLLIRKYQICRARFERFVSEEHLLLTEQNQIRMAISWLELRAVAHHMFEFSRMQVSQVPAALPPNEITLPISSKHFAKPLFNKTSKQLNDQAAEYGSGEPEAYFR